MTTEPPFRILPRLTDHNREFWTAGARRRTALLALHRLPRVHPSAAADLSVVPVEGHGGRDGVGPGDGRVVLGQPPGVDAGARAPVRRRDRRDRRATVGAADDEPRQLPARVDRDRDAGAGHVRAPSGSRRRRLHPPVRTGSGSAPPAAHRDRAGDQRRGSVRHRAPPRARSVGAHARRVPRRDRGRRVDARRHRRAVDVSRSDVDAGRLLRRGRVRRDRRAAAERELVRQRARDVGPARFGHQGVHGGRRRHVRPRAVLPLGVGRIRAGRQGPVRGHHGRERRQLQGERVHGVDPAVLRAVGVDLDRAVRAGALPQVRHDEGTARLDRAERSSQRRAQPERDLPHADDDGRLHGVADHHDAVLVVRLRRPVRRCDGRDRVARGSRCRACGTRRCGSSRWVPRCTAVRRGTSSTT